jgi:hypothetical protein
VGLPQKDVGSWLGRELGSLGLAAVVPQAPELLLRVATWHNGLARLGVAPAPFLVHDLGLAVGAPGEALVIQPNAHVVAAMPRSARDAHEPYVRLVREIAETEVAVRARSWRLSDDLVTVILAKLLAGIWARWPERWRRPVTDPLPLDASIYQGLAPELPALYAAHPRERDLWLCSHVVDSRLALLTAVESLDLDTLRLLGLFRSGDRMAGVVDVLDLLGVLGSPQANDIVNFSLDVIPSMLETKRSSGLQTFSVDGYAGLARRGQLDSLLLSELAHEDLVFEQRYVDNELFYYAHERQNEQTRQLHYLVVDGSASMRGEREVFARGLALSLVKKLSLRGEDVYLRFFDSLLYDLVRAKGGNFDVPYLLCFRSERGRNYGKVFKMLAVELQRIAERERRRPVLYVITHAECHIPVDVLERIKRYAHVYGVFILPSAGSLELDYLELLDRHHVVDRETLLDRGARATKAREICDEAAGFGERPASARRPG